MKLIIRFGDFCHVLNKTTSGSVQKLMVMAVTIAFAIGCLMVASTSSVRHASQQPKDSSLPPLSGDRAVAQLKNNGQYESIQAALGAARYEVDEYPESALATNYANQLRSTFTPEGLRLESTAKGARWQSRWRLRQFGYGDQRLMVGKGRLKTSGNRVVITHQIRSDHSDLENTLPAVEEWFNNTPGGLEHGFTLRERLINPNGPLHLTIAIDGDLTPQTGANGQTLRLTNARGETVLNYEKLKVWDANGTEIVARMSTQRTAVVLEVEEAAAKYPLVIDPTFSAVAKLVANDGEASDAFGGSVAISGDTVIVGANFDNIGQHDSEGSAYIFVRGSNGLWSQQVKLTAANGSADDNFGYSVAISGDTAVIGARSYSVPAGNQGAAYIFVRNGTVWSQQQKLLASDSAAFDQFGHSVAISGDTVIVGARNDEVGGNNGQGSTYIFVRNGTVWSQQQKLTVLGGAAQDNFGASVAISGTTAMVGVSGDDVGADQAQGSAYVFTRSGTTWTLQQELFASDGAAGDQFGNSVDVETGFMSAASAIVGASHDDVNGVISQGSAYVFTRSGTTWTEQQKLVAGDGALNDEFGDSVALSGGTAIIGAYLDDVGSTVNQGSAYVFTRTGGTTWNQRQKLFAFDANAGDSFGSSVAISGTVAIVGASDDDVLGISDRGSAQIFRLGSKRFDFDDDGKADVSVFRPSNAAWFRLDSSTNQFVATAFGQNGDLPAAGDYDGDGNTDIAVFRPSTGTWYLPQSTAGFTYVQFGQAGDIPVPVDADGDGKTDVRVFRPANGSWYRLNSSNGQFISAQFGANGDLPVAGNFDGDSLADLAVFRPSTGSWYLLQTTAGFTGVQFGANGDRPVAGDFDGDGRSDLAVFRPSTGAWYRLDSSTGQFVAIAFGQNGDIPAPADFDGDGKSDLVVFRPANGYWYLLQGSGFAAQPFGMSGDIPVPSQP
ncbi:MAG: FG-GAP-like repeat-containing protein [Pyrinomonadaceae bacterium]